MNKKIKRRLVMGIIFFIISFIQIFIPKGSSIFLLGFPLILFLIGTSLIFDSITLIFYKKSLIDTLKDNRKNTYLFILVSFVGGVILEIIANWLGKLWIFPHINFLIYLIIFIPGYFLYWVLICESYLATKSIIDYFHKGKKKIKKQFSFEKKLFEILGIFGLILIVFAIIFTIIYFTQKNNQVLYFPIILAFFFGLWFLFEYLQHKQNKHSLIQDMIHNYWSPLFAIIVGSIIICFIMEPWNLFHYYWQYINWPWQNAMNFKLPLIVILSWPLHYLLFLSLWRWLTGKQSSEVWKGDLIK